MKLRQHERVALLVRKPPRSLLDSARNFAPPTFGFRRTARRDDEIGIERRDGQSALATGIVREVPANDGTRWR